MIFAIDAGNTRTKLALFELNTIIRLEVFDNFELEKKIKFFFQEYSFFPTIILSTVINIDEKALSWMRENANLILVDHKTSVPFINNYETPHTLGVDRIVLASGAELLYSGENKLVIDAGTCITYDFIDSTSVYHGGAISPGIGLRYKSLNDYTDKLPLLHLEEIDYLVGINTRNAIHSGVLNGIIAEIDGVIDQYRTLYGDLTIILTGGDALFLAKRLKNIIFANSTFLLESLNLLYQYTIENGKKNLS